MSLYKASAFIKKDFLISASYKTTFILQWLSGFIPLLTFYFIAKLFGGSEIRPFGLSGEGYLPFVVIGMAFMNYFGSAVGISSSSIKREQLMGTLESVMVSPTDVSMIVIGMGLWNFIYITINSFLYLLCAGLLFGVNFSNANILAGSLAIILTLICSISLSIISASFAMVYKMGNPISWNVGGFSAFFGGAFFPASILPKSIRLISYFLPITYSLKTIRLSLLKGYSLKDLAPDMSILFLFSISLLFLSTWIFKYAVKKAKKEGNLLHY